MAFEDRSSPSAAVSPSPNSPNVPTSANCVFPYTCTTIAQKKDQQQNGHQVVVAAGGNATKGGFLRITSFALSPAKLSPQPVLKTERRSTSGSRSPSPIVSVSDSPPNAPSPPPPNPPKFCIDNILQPDFGKSAVLKTKTVSATANNSIGNRITFKPYELNAKITSSSGSLAAAPISASLVNVTGSSGFRSSRTYPLTTTSSSLDDKIVAAPLGSLCHAVSQIGKSTGPVGIGNVSVSVKSPEPLKRSVSPAESTTSSTTGDNGSESGKSGEDGKLPQLWPAWVYCTRYSDRPSSGPRSRRMKKPAKAPAEEKRPRTAFSGAQLARLKHEFAENRYLTERRRQQLSQELGLNEAQIKIWFQNKRAKIKKASGHKNPLALQLMAQGLYNHSTVACDEDDMPLA